MKKGLNEAWNNAFFIETLHEIGFHTFKLIPHILPQSGTNLPQSMPSRLRRIPCLNEALTKTGILMQFWWNAVTFWFYKGNLLNYKGKYTIGENVHLFLKVKGRSKQFNFLPYFCIFIAQRKVNHFGYPQTYMAKWLCIWLYLQNVAK